MKHRILVTEDNPANMELMVYPLNAHGHHAMTANDSPGGLVMAGGREKLPSAGFDGYTSRPVEPERFVGMIEEFLGSSHAGSLQQARTRTFHSNAQEQRWRPY